MKNEVEINIGGTLQQNDCFKGINQINNAFLLSKKDIFYYDIINIKSDSIFFPSNVLVILGYHLDNLQLKGKDIKNKLTSKVYNFLLRSGYLEYIDSNLGSGTRLLNSVIFPFSKISSQKDLKDYLDKYKGRIKNEESRNLISSYISELHYNSIEHGGTQDIYIMGQLHPNLENTDITIYDAGSGMIKDDVSSVINDVYKNYSTEDFYDEIKNKYGLNVFLIILCVCTQFSSKGLNEGGLGLWELSSYLLKHNGKIQIVTDKIYIELQFLKICDKIDKDSIIITVKELDNKIIGTFISFTYSI
ncbi:MAG: hypothetical protein PHH98_03050 [Candidatus Gracilibacteria bacterium]|nr:hypothetical protein [Candidatus Gracilibacteria bacterium]